MGLFDRHSQPLSQTTPLYTIGSNTTKLVVGLGNTGKQYDGTRHNIGFMCVDDFASRHDGQWITKKDLKTDLCDIRLGGTRVLLIKPTTFMNLSGEAVQAVQSFYKIANSETVVLYDELDIPFGQIRTRVGGSSAGHNGIKSLIQHCGEDFARIRIGIKGTFADKHDTAAYVLQKFTADEQAELPGLHAEAVSILTDYLYSGALPHETRTFII